MTVGPADQAGILRRDAARDGLAVGAAVLLGSAALASAHGLGAGEVARALLLYAAGCGLVWRALPGAHPYPRFGAANRITLLRLGACAVLAALVGAPPPARPEALAWTVVVLATVGALLDAVDGALARRSGMASSFGARFDMETDAALTLVLCALVMQFDKAGAWVLASGALRYAFVAAAALFPWLAAPLAPSRRRQTVCVVQITTLIVCLGPVVTRPAASTLAAASLLALAWSFAVDVRALARGRQPTVEHTA